MKVSYLILWAALVGAALTACAKNEATDKSAVTLRNYHELTLPQYQTPQGWQTECVGYHLVDLPGEIEESTTGSFNDDLIIQDGGYKTNRADISIDRIENTRGKFLEYATRRGTAPKIVITELKERIDFLNQTHIAGYQKEIPELRKDIEIYETFGDTLEKDAIWFDENSYLHNAAHLVLWRSSHIFWIVFDELRPKEKRIQEAREFSERFIARKIGEIPKEAGFCVPYGFIKGVSTIPYRNQTTMRVKGEPGTLYTLYLDTLAEATKDTKKPYSVGLGMPLHSVGELNKVFLPKKSVSIGAYTHDEKILSFTADPSISLDRCREIGAKIDKKNREDGTDERDSLGKVYLSYGGFYGENNPLYPNIGAQIVGFPYYADIVMQCKPALSPDIALPQFEDVLKSIRLRKENVEAFETLKKSTEK